LKRALLAFALLVPLLAFGQASELENPGSVAAVQERPYRLTHELNLAIGSLPLDAFTKSFYGQVGYIFHFTDTFAWQVGRGAYNYNIQTGLRQRLETDYGVLPTAVEEAQFFVGSDLIVSPLYGKVALLNKFLLHVESSLILGLSIFKYSVAGFSPAVNVGAALRLFQNKYVSYRIDVTDQIVITTRKASNVLALQLVLAVNFGSTGAGQ
jgi:outer membrane beta-barrel protein